MKQEIKICLPFYKIAYSVFFTAVLSVIRGVGSASEIGAALEPQMAFLAAVFCADTYVQEIAAKRSEVERLYPVKNRIFSVFRRLGVQELYLLLLTCAGYGMFLAVQKPMSYTQTQSGWLRLLGSDMAALIVTLIFWGMLSHTISCLFRTMWAGVGGCLILWILTNSRAGERLFGKWNLFSYSFREIGNETDFGWLCGKAVCLGLCAVMAAALPKIIKKRG